MKRTTHPRRDALLVVRCQLGEADAFDELVECWHPRLWSYVRRLSADTGQAEEAIQETWLRILRGLPKLRQADRFAPWAYRIGRCAVIDGLRRRYAEPESNDIDPEDLESQAEATDEFELATLRVGVMKLPWIERDVVTLFYLQELSLAEVADVLEVPLGTVKSRLFRARGLLRQLLTSNPQGASI